MGVPYTITLYVLIISSQLLQTLRNLYNYALSAKSRKYLFLYSLISYTLSANYWIIAFNVTNAYSVKTADNDIN